MQGGGPGRCGVWGTPLPASQGAVFSLCLHRTEGTRNSRGSVSQGQRFPVLVVDTWWQVPALSRESVSWMVFVPVLLVVGRLSRVQAPGRAHRALMQLRCAWLAFGASGWLGRACTAGRRGACRPGVAFRVLRAQDTCRGTRRSARRRAGAAGDGRVWEEGTTTLLPVSILGFLVAAARRRLCLTSADEKGAWARGRRLQCRRLRPSVVVPARSQVRRRGQWSGGPGVGPRRGRPSECRGDSSSR